MAISLTAVTGTVLKDAIFQYQVEDSNILYMQSLQLSTQYKSDKFMFYFATYHIPTVVSCGADVQMDLWVVYFLRNMTLCSFRLIFRGINKNNNFCFVGVLIFYPVKQTSNVVVLMFFLTGLAFSLSLLQSTDRSKRFTALVTFTHSHTHWWRRLPRRVPTCSSGALNCSWWAGRHPAWQLFLLSYSRPDRAFMLIMKLVMHLFQAASRY